MNRPALRRYREPLALWLEMSRSGSEQQQLAALDSLGVIGSDQAVERLREVAEDRQAAFRLRRMALLSLEQQASPVMTEALIKLLRDEQEPAIRDLVVQVLGAVGDERAVSPLAELFEGQGGFSSIMGSTRERIVLALRRFGNRQQARQCILKALQETEPGMVRAASVAAADLEWTLDVAEKLAGLVGDGKWSVDVRATAIEALTRMGPHEAQQADMVQLLVQDANPAELRELALLFLAQLDSAAARQTITQVAARTDDPLGAQALAALSQRYRPVAIPRRRAMPRGGGSRLEEILRRHGETKWGNDQILSG